MNEDIAKEFDSAVAVDKRMLSSLMMKYHELEEDISIVKARIENAEATRDIRILASSPSMPLMELLDILANTSYEVCELKYQISNYLSGDAAAKAEARLSIAELEVTALKEGILYRFA